MKHQMQPRKNLQIITPGGREFDLTLDDNVINASDISKVELEGGKKLIIYDPGYSVTASTKTSICFIDGVNGILKYRAKSLLDLTSWKFEEVAHLLIFGHKPTQQELDYFVSKLSSQHDVPQYVKQIISNSPPGSHPMSLVMSAMAALSADHPELNPAIAGENIYRDQSVLDDACILALAKYTTICCLVARHKKGLDVLDFSLRSGEVMGIGEKFMSYYTRANKEDTESSSSEQSNMIDMLCTIHAEHGLNCSTAAMLHLASSGVDIFSSMTGASGALYGPLHGGAAQKCLEMLEEILANGTSLEDFLESVKRKERKLTGFGHRIYKTIDPRCIIIRDTAQKILKDSSHNGLLTLAMTLEIMAAEDEYFTSRNLKPNVDYYSGLLYHSLGLKPEMYTLMFAMERAAGWIAHWRAFQQLPPQTRRIWRPLQLTE